MTKSNLINGYYKYGCLLVFLIHLIVSTCYIIYIGTAQSDPKMYISYQPVYSYFEYNSYSLIPSIATFPLIPFLFHSVHQEIKVFEGDFFGILGVLLLLALTCFHDGIGVQRVITEIQPNDTIKNPYIFKDGKCDINLEKLPLDNYQWVNAWSNKPFCMRKFIQGELARKKEHELMEEQEAHALYFKIHDNKKQMRTLQTLSSSINEEEDEIKNICENINAVRKLVVRPAFWMTQINEELKCCGPFGEQVWKCLFKELSCDYNVTCIDPFHEFIEGVFYQTSVFLHTEGIMYVLTLLAFSVNYIMLKKQDAETEQGEEPEGTTSTARISLTEKGEEHGTRLKRVYSHRRSSAGSIKFPTLLSEPSTQRRRKSQLFSTDHHFHNSSEEIETQRRK